MAVLKVVLIRTLEDFMQKLLGTWKWWSKGRGEKGDTATSLCEGSGPACARCAVVLVYALP